MNEDGQPETNIELPASKIKVNDQLPVTQPGEITICEIKRHPVGIILVFVGVSFLLLLGALLVFGVLYKVGQTPTGGTSTEFKLSLVFYLLVVGCSLIFTFIANEVYWGNYWILTTDSITQVSRTSLFSRQSSQLSLNNLEDVTAEQNGVLTHLFNYGVLSVETAGERSKFSFPYCPNPNYYAQQVLAAREAFEQQLDAKAMAMDRATQD